MQVDDDTINIKLPAAIYNYFNIPVKTWMNNKSRVAVGEDVRQQEIVVEDERTYHMSISQMPIEGDDRDVLILMDILENQTYGNALSPVLAHIPWDIESDARVSIDSVLYLPLNCDVVSNIRVSLTDEKLNTISKLNGYVTILRLHFCPRPC